MSTPQQSLPYSYLTISVTSNSYRPPQVQVMTAIDQTWTGQRGASNLNFTTSGDAGFYWFYNPDEIPFTQLNEIATYGSVLFGTTLDKDVTASCGPSDEVLQLICNERRQDHPDNRETVCIHRPGGNIQRPRYMWPYSVRASLLWSALIAWKLSTTLTAHRQASIALSGPLFLKQLNMCSRIMNLYTPRLSLLMLMFAHEQKRCRPRLGNSMQISWRLVCAKPLVVWNLL